MDKKIRVYCRDCESIGDAKPVTVKRRTLYPCQYCGSIRTEKTEEKNRPPRKPGAGVTQRARMR